MTTSTPLLTAQHLTCIREDRILFDALSFDVHAGDIVQIEGPNGSGKTSLLRILAGLSMPYDGAVLYQQQPIQSQREHYHQQLLYIGHLAGIKGEMTAAENLSFNLAMKGLSTVDVENTLSHVNLIGFEDALASHLSAGQHRRIALAQLWVSQAKLWILDEPFTAIDKQGVALLEQLICQHTTQGGAVILTTHQDLSLPDTSYRKIRLHYRFD